MKEIQSAARHGRGQRGNSLVYPVLSRRAGGLSIGINLFPVKKECSFSCPYCEVLPFPSGEAFSLQSLAENLDTVISEIRKTPSTKGSIKDICLSGNGEPTLSPYLFDALEIAAEARRKFRFDPASVPVRIITNSTGFLNSKILAGLVEFHEREGLSVWAKLDAGTDGWFETISGSALKLDDVIAAIIDFSRRMPVTIQTMLCSIGGKTPNLHEARCYAMRIQEMLNAGAQIETIHFYSVSRPPSGLNVGAVSDEFVLQYMKEVEDSLKTSLPFHGFGNAGALHPRLA